MLFQFSTKDRRAHSLPIKFASSVAAESPRELRLTSNNVSVLLLNRPCIFTASSRRFLSTERLVSVLFLDSESNRAVEQTLHIHGVIEKVPFHGEAGQCLVFR